MESNTTHHQLLSPREASGRLPELLLLDVRTPAEYQEAHIEGSVLHPLGDLDPRKVADLTSGRKGCLIICRSGGRARKAADKLTESGISGVAVLDGGVSAWDASGLPLLRGKKTISLERQVRIVAGILVVVGSLLGYFVHPAWTAFSGFVGAGLVFAGVTDTCGMAMLLARMPWNTRCEGASPTCATGK